jgi:prepilin-type N-terminal cleavage/methylation domain-containing protein
MDRSRGLTLVEVLVAGAIFSVLIVGAKELFATGQHGYVLAQSQARVRAEAQRALESCAADLRAAGPAIAPPPGAPRSSVSCDREAERGRRERFVLWARVERGRVILERIFARDGLPPVIDLVADLGPASLPHGAPLGGVSFETVAPAVVRVKVSARALVEGRGEPFLVPIELESDVVLR